MERSGHPGKNSRRGSAVLEEILSTLAFLILLFTGLYVLTGNFGPTSDIGSFIAVLFFVFGAYGTALDILDLLDLFCPPVHSTHSPH